MQYSHEDLKRAKKWWFNQKPDIKTGYISNEQGKVFIYEHLIEDTATIRVYIMEEMPLYNGSYSL